MMRAQTHASADFRDAIRQQALSMGLSRVGFARADALPEAVQRRWQRWLSRKCAGVMRYLERPEPRRTHPRDLMPEARSAIVVLAGYFQDDPNRCAPANVSADPTSSGSGLPGKVARYAWGRDYHQVLRAKLSQLGEWMSHEAMARGIVSRETQHQFRPCVDSTPLDERSLAVEAGLGFIGKNTLLLTPDRGSWALIGILLTSLELASDEPMRSAAASCGSCRRCLEACPTQAFSGPYQLDPRRCLSYLTIEQRDPIAEEFASRMEGWVFGCDICQEVCPFNERPLRRVLPELAPAEGIGPWIHENEIDAIPSGKAFQRRWSHTPLSRPGLKGLKRNFEALRQWWLAQSTR